MKGNRLISVLAVAIPLGGLIAIGILFIFGVKPPLTVIYVLVLAELIAILYLYSNRPKRKRRSIK